MLLEEFVTLDSGASDSARIRIDCRASIVADGGVFSPNIGLFKWVGVALPLGVGVSEPALVGLLSTDRRS